MFSSPAGVALAAVAAGQVFEHEVVERLPRHVDGRAVAEAVDDVRVAHAVERDRLVAKVFDERVFELEIDRALQEKVEGFDHDRLRRSVRRRRVAREINFGIAAAPQTFQNVVAPVQPALLKFQFTHLVTAPYSKHRFQRHTPTFPSAPAREPCRLRGQSQPPRLR